MTVNVPLILSLVLTAMPPLSSDELVRLETARDGFDHQDEAFVALVDNVRRWTPDPGDTPIRLRVDATQLMDDPAAYRGDVCRLSGRLEQRTPLTGPHAGVEEWFIRPPGDSAGPSAEEALLVYVVAPETPGIAVGRPVEIDARFYKRVALLARDDQSHSYAAFVGAFPRLIVDEASSGMGSAWGLVVPLALMLVVFVVLLVVTRSGKRRTKVRVPGDATDDEEEEEDDAPLPDDPVEALAELRKRARSS